MQARLCVIFVGLLLFLVASTLTGYPVSSPARQATVRYVLDNQQGKFIAHAFAGGLFWFKGHDHYLAARDFSGEVELTPNTISPASLRLVVKSNSLEETGTDFTDAQKKIINKEVHDIVLWTEKYPEKVFQSTGDGHTSGIRPIRCEGCRQFNRNGVTRQETIPLKLSVSDNDLQAVGQFSIDRDDYKVKATSAAHGTVRVQDKVNFEFDIVGHRK